MRKAIVIGLLGIGVFASPVSADLQSDADAAWEGLDSTTQQNIRSTELTGDLLDTLVITVRDSDNQTGCIETSPGNTICVGSEPAEIEEDSPNWDCTTMGNRICGPLVAPLNAPVALIELPRTF